MNAERASLGVASLSMGWPTGGCYPRTRREGRGRFILSQGILLPALACVALGFASFLPLRADEPGVDDEPPLRSRRTVSREGSANDCLRRASHAMAEGDHVEARKLVDRAIELAPDLASAYEFRAALLSDADEHEAAIADYEKLTEIAPQDPRWIDRRGDAQLKAGNVETAIADFDAYLAKVPEATPHHWRRGIAYYWAGRYEDGRHQFEGYQSVDASDVENAVWRFLCMAREKGIETARKEILRVGSDPRVPMAEIYELFAGRAKEADVFAAVERGGAPENARRYHLFYAHLYVALFDDLEGRVDAARKHLRKAVDDHKNEHYMYDVARVHLARLDRAERERAEKDGKTPSTKPEATPQPESEPSDAAPDVRKDPNEKKERGEKE
jgi:lipoprotein NlpI